MMYTHPDLGVWLVYSGSTPRECQIPELGHFEVGNVGQNDTFLCIRCSPEKDFCLLK